MISDYEKEFLEKAIALSRKGMQEGHGGPFGCVVVKDEKVIGEGYNMVISSNDPTAHAEVVAIRNACGYLKEYQLTGCNIFTSCEPCPMCLGAIYWARPSKVIYANTRDDAAAIAFDDDFIYREIGLGMADRTIPFIHYPHPSAKNVFKEWVMLNNKKLY